MKTHSATIRLGWHLLLLAAGASLIVPAASAQVPVDEDGNPIQPVDQSMDESATAAGEAGPATEALMTPEELQALVGPIALYPDDLLAIVLPASTYPLEIVQAARFIEEYKEDESLEPDESWDDSVVALLNYPEVLEMMNEDLDWTWRLGEAVANQQPDVIAAVEAFRDRAYAAGNLKSDEHQTVTNNDDGVIEIEPVDEEIIYVPYYEPERVVVHQPRPAYYYYPRPYPVYYYPYPHGYNFYANHFWGVTTAFTIGWSTNNLHVFHHSFWGHPYYGRTYYPHWWYRRPSITIFNTWYGERRSERTRDHYANGDLWRPRHTGGARPGFHRSRADYYRERRRERSSEGYRDRPGANAAGRTGVARSDDQRDNNRRDARRNDGRPAFRGDDSARASARNRSSSEDTAIRFREREGRRITPPVNRERAAADASDRRTVTTRREAQERRRAVTERAERPAQRSQRSQQSQQSQRAVPRRIAPNDTSRRVTERRSRVQQSTVRREAAARSDSRRQSVTRAPRATAPARATAPRSASRPSASAPRSVSRPSSSAPRASAPRPSSRAGNAVRRADPSSSRSNRRVRDR